MITTNNDKEKYMIKFLNRTDILKKTEKGITLIVLLITIVVLLILAGISIAIVTGDNGMLTKTKEAKEQTNIAQISEIKKIEFQELILYIQQIGFTYVEGEIESGVIVKDKKGNEFVWVPINRDNMIAQNNHDLENKIKNKIYPMVIKTNDNNYSGINYNFEYDEKLKKPKIEIRNIDKEPGIVEKDTVVENIQIAEPNAKSKEEFLEILQKDFNNMVKSVYEHKGFFIARYETSYSEEKGIRSLKNEEQLKPPQDSKSWYYIYNKQKYEYLGNNNLQSYTIWGCQYDQIMIWMKDIRNDSKNAEYPFYIIDSTDMGYYNETGGFNTIKRKTGFYPVKGIYDLAGNAAEFTMEIYDKNNRVFRGNNVYSNGTEAPASKKIGYVPSVNYPFGSRFVLY